MKCLLFKNLINVCGVGMMCVWGWDDVAREETRRVDGFVILF